MNPSDLPSAPGLYDPQAETDRRHGANLPHWSQAGATYFVTFRLADSLPRRVLSAWESERRQLLGHATLDIGTRERLARRLFTKRIEAHLDRGSGACLLAQPECAALVAGALTHFHEQRYTLWAWCVMPNHVHALVEPLAPYGLPAVLHSWKAYSATGVNRLPGRSGPLWQKESFDHLVRRESAFDYFVDYILGNPEGAGLEDWPWRGHCGTGLLTGGAAVSDAPSGRSPAGRPVPP